MFVSRGIPSFAELLRKSIYRFKNRIELSLNSIITACLSPLIYISSPIRKWWSSVLYIYIYLYFRTFIKYNIMVIYKVDYEQKKNNTKIK